MALLHTASRVPAVAACAVAAGCADDLVHVDAFGSRVEPVELPAGSEPAHRPRELAADGSAADATLGGGAVISRVPLEVRRNPPLALDIGSAPGARRGSPSTSDTAGLAQDAGPTRP